MKPRKPDEEIRIENVAVKIMGRDYVFACAPDERDSLLKCVALVDGKMNAIKAVGKITAADRIAVMAALTIASDFVTQAPASVGSTQDTKSSLAFEQSQHRMKGLSEEIRRFIEDVGPRCSDESRDLFSS